MSRLLTLAAIAVVAIVGGVAVSEMVDANEAGAWSRPSIEAHAIGCERGEATITNNDGNPATITSQTGGVFHEGSVIPAHGNLVVDFSGVGHFEISVHVNFPDNADAHASLDLAPCPTTTTTSTTSPPTTGPPETIPPSVEIGEPETITAVQPSFTG